jgi:hypothetical protein
MMTNLAFGEEVSSPIHPTEFTIDRVFDLNPINSVCAVAVIGMPVNPSDSMLESVFFPLRLFVPTLELSENCKLWINAAYILSQHVGIGSDEIGYSGNDRGSHPANEHRATKTLIGFTIRF